MLLDSVDHSSDNSAIYKIYVVATTVAKTSVGAQHTNLNADAQSFALVVSGVPANTTLQGQVY